MVLTKIPGELIADNTIATADLADNAVTTAKIANTAVTASSTYPVPAGWSADLLGNFFSGLRPINGVPIFEDGNISIDSSDDAVGVIADRSALGVLKSVDMNKEQDRDISLRATEVVITADYGVFELDDSKGVALTLDAGTPATS